MALAPRAAATPDSDWPARLPPGVVASLRPHGHHRAPDFLHPTRPARGLSPFPRTGPLRPAPLQTSSPLPLWPSSPASRRPGRSAAAPALLAASRPASCRGAPGARVGQTAPARQGPCQRLGPEKAAVFLRASRLLCYKSPRGSAALPLQRPARSLSRLREAGSGSAGGLWPEAPHERTAAAGWAASPQALTWQEGLPPGRTFPGVLAGGHRVSPAAVRACPRGYAGVLNTWQLASQRQRRGERRQRKTEMET